jgi:Tfp pilus assembly protein PilN
MIPAALKKISAFGSGVGIQITGPRGAESLHIAAVRVRPGGARLTGSLTIEDFRRQPAAEWGATYAAFLRKLGLAHASAVVLLPRADVILRPMPLPGVSNKDLDNAVRFQIDGLHPYGDDDVYPAWCRLPGNSTVLVAIVRRDAIERYAAPFEEAGVRVGAFTCSAAAIYSGLRLFGETPAAELLAVDDSTGLGSSGAQEFYGESPARPLFSAVFESTSLDASNDRGPARAAAELRIAPGTEPVALAALLQSDSPLPFAAGLCSACPHSSLPFNLLPAERRQTGSPLRWVPSAVLAVAVLLLAGWLAFFPAYEKRKYLRSLEQQIAAATPAANRAAAIDKQVDDMRRRIQLLDTLRAQPKADTDVLAELTRILTPPTWVNLMQLSAKQVVVSGETPESAPLLSLLDASKLFKGSEFQGSPTRLAGGVEQFRIKTNREGGK